MRIWLLEQVEKLEHFLKDVIRVLVSRAEAEIDHVMPGYTHLQVSHHQFPRPMSKLNLWTARTTHPLVAFPPVPRCLFHQRLEETARPQATHLRLAPWVRSVGWESLHRPSRSLAEGAWLSILDSELNAGKFSGSKQYHLLT